ncbi:MAG: glycine betaine/L-proline ABC transporter substrate-binding protein ProX [Desulfosarcinaceae bacterium]|nr:glycine betaine/L-proline ABC transporter substrate-binding protein ProX [Desulfosarcinaceae bacterium]
MQFRRHCSEWGPALAVGLVVLMVMLGTGGVRRAGAADAETRSSGSGERGTVRMARATWDTGWFQAEVIKQLLESLGYRVEGPVTMSNWGFYQAATKGSVDLWVNGWLPGHTTFLASPAARANLEVVGYVVRAGALQGYLVDAATAQAHGIRRLSDLKDPALAHLFDRDGNGKADLIGCNIGWGCAAVVDHHLAAYGLQDSVEQIQGDYSPMMAELVERYQAGDPVLFYTWTPNWTVGTLQPGREVRWLEVPFASLPNGLEAFESQVAVADLPGCPSTPCAMGFPPNDIRAVVNRTFLEAHPDIRQLLEMATISLEDISRQNARMISGEGSYGEIQMHAREWLRAHAARTAHWLVAARSRQRPMALSPPATADTAAPDIPHLKVVTQRTEPFVFYRNQRYQGFTIDLWEQMAQMLDLRYELYGVNTIAKLIDEVRRGVADVAVSGIGITSNRERQLDFSHTFLTSGLQIMVSEDADTVLGEVLLKVFAVIFAPELLYGVGLFALVLIAAAHVIWLLERRHNPQFSPHYRQGIWQSIWWAVVTVTTVGYGDKTPTGGRGRAFGLLWILAGYFVFAYFTATVTSTVTVRELHSSINDPSDLYSKRVATVEKSTAEAFLDTQGISCRRLKTIDAAFGLLENGEVDAIVYDAPVLQHYARREGKGKVKVVGLTFEKKSYGFAFPVDSSLRDRINVALLELIENGTYQEIRARWFVE